MSIFNGTVNDIESNKHKTQVIDTDDLTNTESYPSNAAVNAALNAYAKKPESVMTAGNFAMLGIDGNLIDSGIDIDTAPYVTYEWYQADKLSTISTYFVEDAVDLYTISNLNINASENCPCKFNLMIIGNSPDEDNNITISINESTNYYTRLSAGLKQGKKSIAIFEFKSVKGLWVVHQGVASVGYTNPTPLQIGGRIEEIPKITSLHIVPTTILKYGTQIILEVFN